MGKIVNLEEYKSKQYKNLNMGDYDLPIIYITKSNKTYDVIIIKDNEKILFNQVPLVTLASAIYVASYCKDILSEYLGELLSTDVIEFDKICWEEMRLD